MKERERIVAEVSVNWREDQQTRQQILAQRFEDVIAHNKERGYMLESWQLSQVTYTVDVRESLHPYKVIHETIIAVFSKHPKPIPFDVEVETYQRP